MNVVIYHYPACGTSRTALGLIQSAGYTPVVIDYMAAGWSRAHLLGLFAAADLTPHQALRANHDLVKELDLLSPAIDADALLDAMIKHPILVNRPFVCTRKGVRLCRPSERVLDLLDRHPPSPAQP